jgi:hypothetical protein
MPLRFVVFGGLLLFVLLLLPSEYGSTGRDGAQCPSLSLQVGSMVLQVVRIALDPLLSASSVRLPAIRRARTAISRLCAASFSNAIARGM